MVCDTWNLQPQLEYQASLKNKKLDNTVGKKRVTEEKLMPLEEIIAEVRALVLRARQANIQKKDRSVAIKNERKKHRSLKGATIKTRAPVLNRQRVKEPRKEKEAPVQEESIRELEVLNTKQVPKEACIPIKKKK